MTGLRIATIALGALPATCLTYPASVVLVLGMQSLSSGEWALIPVGACLILWGGAGIFGALSLWAIGFGYAGNVLTRGLSAGMLALFPLAGVYVIFALAGGGWFVPAAALTLAPCLTAWYWRRVLRRQLDLRAAASTDETVDPARIR